MSALHPSTGIQNPSSATPHKLRIHGTLLGSFPGSILWHNPRVPAESRSRLQKKVLTLKPYGRPLFRTPRAYQLSRLLPRVESFAKNFLASVTEKSRALLESRDSRDFRKTSQNLRKTIKNRSKNRSDVTRPRIFRKKFFAKILAPKIFL